LEDIHYSPLGPQFTVQQDTRSITIVDGRRTVTYKLDGSESTRTEKTVRGDTWTYTAKARFVTYALLVTTKTERPDTGGTWEDMMILSPDSPGSMRLVSVATTTSMNNGMNTMIFKYERK